jgi:uncharacterized protein (TIGR00730 family)
MSVLRNVCVYCGSSAGDDSAFADAARALGKALAEARIGLVYGGGNSGLMGILARSVLAHDGHVTGIIPEFLKSRELLLKEAQDVVVVDDMHTRKRLMFERADAFVALPGGIGTLEELVEQLTWVQLDRHHKPVLIVDIAGFWRPLLDLFAHMHGQGFIPPAFEIRYMVAEKIVDVLPMIEAAIGRASRRDDISRPLDPRF